LSELSEPAAIILAAGASRRFGSDKLLHPVTLYGVTRPLAVHSMLPWLEVFRQITVVVRPEAEKLRSAFQTMLTRNASYAIRWVVCEEAEKGLANSLASGVDANRDASGWLIGLADMPAVPIAAIVEVQNALKSGAVLAAPFCGGQRGHPVGFASPYREELLALQGDSGARSLLKRDISSLVQIQFNHKGILADIDNLSDLHNLQV
jgi:molybdenum cofactor cytidylyltransferase